MTQLELDIKTLIIESLGLEDIEPQDIPGDQPLFGDGLGLDSVDALELALALQKRFAFKIDPDAKDTRRHFANVHSLAAFVMSKQNEQRDVPHANQ
jgi:acyl carrier protein